MLAQLSAQRRRWGRQDPFSRIGSRALTRDHGAVAGPMSISTAVVPTSTPDWSYRGLK
jgi:hypothetical protein